MVRRPAAGACGVHAPWKPNGTRPRPQCLWCRPLACRLVMPPVTWTPSVEPATAGTLLRQARKRAGLSQVELAARAGVTQSVISAYESGHRQPSIPALARLIEAAGSELTLGLRQQPGRLRQLSGPVGHRVRRHRRDLIAAAAAHGVQNL